MGAVNVAMTFVSMIIVDRAGRRLLLLISCVGMMAMTIVLTFATVYSSHAPWVAYLAIVAVILFVVSFATGLGSIPWFLVTELFTSNARGKATTAAVVVNWCCTTIIGFCFPLLVNITKEYTFLIFTGLLACFIAYILKFVPETRGKNIDEIQRELHARFGDRTYANGGRNGNAASPLGDMGSNVGINNTTMMSPASAAAADVANRNIYYPSTATMIEKA